MLKEKREHSWSEVPLILIYSVIIVAFAQFNLSILAEYFTVSIGIILLPVFLRLVNKFPLISVSLVSGLGVALSRAFASLALTGSMGNFITAYMPEAAFYISYGCLLYLYYDSDRRNLTRINEMYVIVLIDYVSNMVEVFLRMDVSPFTLETQCMLIFVAFIRGIIVTVLLQLIEGYEVALLKREDIKIYRKLLMTVTELSGETVCMKENMDMVEGTMSRAYKLYDGLKTDKSPFAAEALRLATNVHEIKKSYGSVMRGVSSALESNIDKEGMELSEIIQILLNRTDEYARAEKVELHWTADCPEGIMTHKYYYLMSVFNNLFTNAVEAAENGRLTLSVKVTEAEGDYVTTVENDGKQIPSDRIGDIFNAGFSTKINYETGVVGRGLGLLIVKNIIEKEFAGEIKVTSGDGITRFTVKIPKDRMEA